MGKALGGRGDGNPHGRKQGLGERRNTHGAATYLLGLGLADGVRDWLLLLLHGTLGKQLDKLVKVHSGLHHFLPHQQVDVSEEAEKNRLEEKKKKIYIN